MSADPEFDTAKSEVAPPAAASGPIPRPGADVSVAPSADSLPKPPPPANPPAEGTSRNDAEGSRPSVDANDVRTDVTARYCLGRIAGGIGCLVIMGVLIWAGCHANDVIDKVSAQKDTMTPAMEISIWVSIGAHAAISIAAIYFGYSMLRLAERMLLPRHLLHDETKVNVVRALLGVKTPAESAVDGVKQISENLSTILKPIAELARVVLGTDSDKKK